MSKIVDISAGETPHPIRERAEPVDPTGRTVVIQAGAHAGAEGICLGRLPDGTGWSVLPEGSEEIVELDFPRQFGVLIIRGQTVGRN